MKKVLVGAVLLLTAVAMVAQGPPANSQSKLTAPQATITAAVVGLGCSTTAGTNSFSVQAWSWGASNSGISSTSGGSGAGKAVISDLTVEKSLDGCSPALFGGTVTGKNFASMTLTQEDSNHNVVLTLTLTNVRVSAWTISGSQGAALPVEAVSLAFQKVCITEAGSGSKFCYNAATATTF